MGARRVPWPEAETQVEALGGVGEGRDQISGVTARLSAQDREEAEQEASLRMLQMAQRQTILNPLHLLRRIARNLVIDQLRYNQRKVQAETAPEIEVLACPQPSPEQAIMARERLSRAMSVIQAMPERRREAFLLHRIDGLSYAQIARKMSVSPKAVEKHMALAMLDLARGMEQSERPKVG